MGTSCPTSSHLDRMQANAGALMMYYIISAPRFACMRFLHSPSFLPGKYPMIGGRPTKSVSRLQKSIFWRRSRGNSLGANPFVFSGISVMLNDCLRHSSLLLTSGRNQLIKNVVFAIIQLVPENQTVDSILILALVRRNELLAERCHLVLRLKLCALQRQWFSSKIERLSSWLVEPAELSCMTLVAEIFYDFWCSHSFTRNFKETYLDFDCVFFTFSHDRFSSPLFFLSIVVVRDRLSQTKFRKNFL